MEGPIDLQVPLTNDIYCYTSLITDEGKQKYVTLFIAPLLRIYIDNGDNIYESAIGGHRFLTRTDGPMYLIPYDLPICSQYGKEVTFNLKAETPEEPTSITAPMEFDTRIAQFFQYKIDEGVLYKQEGKTWTLVSI